jgi:hypothetical protein
MIFGFLICKLVSFLHFGNNGLEPSSPSLPPPESEYESKPLLVRSRSM